jgi:hypothetical protein
MANQIDSSMLVIPKQKRGALGATVIIAFILFFVVLSVINLLNHVAMIASAIWLLLVVLAIWTICKMDGLARVLVNVLGCFASRQFVESLCEGAGHARIGYGYELFGRRYFYLTVPVEKIALVDWHTGQGSERLGRDINDWNVVVWYDHDDPVERQKREGTRNPDQDLCIVGPSGPKSEIAALGHSLVDFLCKAGASLRPGKDECSFVRKTADTEADR